MFPRVPQLFILYSFSLDELFSWFQLLPIFDGFQLFISSPTLSLKLQICISNCLSEISTWMSYRHLKHNMFKTEFIIFSLSRKLLSYSLSQLLVQLSNPSSKSGIIFDSSYSLMPQIRSAASLFFKQGLYLYASLLCLLSLSWFG